MESVYIIKQIDDNKDLGVNLCKIGRSKNVRERISSLQIGNPNKITLIAQYECYNSVGLESIAHKKYENHCVGGEWFKFTDSELIGCMEFISDIALELNKKLKCNKKNMRNIGNAVPINTNNTNIIFTKMKCLNCNGEFSCKQSLWKHKKYHCKPTQPKQNDLALENEKLKQQLRQLKQQLRQLKYKEIEMENKYLTRQFNELNNEMNELITYLNNN